MLRDHKKHQATVKMRNRQHYHDLGLVFAKEWCDLHRRTDSLGLPLQVNTIGEREFGRLIKAAGVRRIKFHGLRHTVATLMLSAGAICPTDWSEKASEIPNKTTPTQPVAHRSILGRSNPRFRTIFRSRDTRASFV